MRAKWLLGLAGLLLTTPGAVAQEVWGEAGVTAGYYVEPDFDYEETYVEAWGDVLFRMNNGFNVQVGTFGGHDFDHDVSYGGFESDFFYANSAYAAGVYAGAFANTNSYTNYFVGAEGVIFFSMADLGLWAGWESNDGDDNLEAGTFLAFYINPDTAIGGRLFWNGNDNFDNYTAGVFAEHRFTGTQWSVWAATDFRQWSVPGPDFEAWNTRLGVTLFFDPAGTTLQEHYRAMPF